MIDHVIVFPTTVIISVFKDWLKMTLNLTFLNLLLISWKLILNFSHYMHLIWFIGKKSKIPIPFEFQIVS